MYDHARRLWHAQFYKTGRWSQSDTALLKKLVLEHDRNWSTIASHVGRSPTACRDKWRDITNGESASGKWTREEDEKLLELVKEACNGDISKIHSEESVDWSSISKSMGTRTRTQCRTHWRYINPNLKPYRQSWVFNDDLNLIQKLVDFNVSYESEIIWKDVAMGTAWTREQIRFRWYRLKQALGLPKDGKKPIDFAKILRLMKQYPLSGIERPSRQRRILKTLRSLGPFIAGESESSEESSSSSPSSTEVNLNDDTESSESS